MRQTFRTHGPLFIFLTHEELIAGSCPASAVPQDAPVGGKLGPERIHFITDLEPWLRRRPDIDASFTPPRTELPPLSVTIAENVTVEVLLTPVQLNAVGYEASGRGESILEVLRRILEDSGLADIARDDDSRQTRIER